MHALIFLFLALTALFVGATGSPFNEEVASNLANMGAFVGGFFTPVLTVGAVWMAYRQLKHSQDRYMDEQKQREDEKIARIVTNKLERISNSVSISDHRLNEISNSLKNKGVMNYMHTNPEELIKKYRINPDIKNHIIALLESIIDLKKCDRSITELEETSDLIVETQKNELRKEIQSSATMLYASDDFIGLLINEIEEKEGKNSHEYSVAKQALKAVEHIEDHQ